MAIKKKPPLKKKRGRQGEGGGRPKFVIDYDQVEKFAAIQCTHEEIASFLGCSADTLARDEKFCVLHKKGIDTGRMSLRRKQWAALEAGNNTMLIWLGKQYLGQKEKHEHSGDKDAPVEVINVSVKDEDAVKSYMDMIKRTVV